MRYDLVFIGLFVLVAAYSAAHSQPSFGHTVYFANSLVPHNLSVAINGTEAFISEVNQSAYVVFYPSLAGAYRYLGEAETNASDGSYAEAYALLGLARSSAEQQLHMIDEYKYATFAVLAALLVVLALLLRNIMRPLKLRRHG